MRLSLVVLCDFSDTPLGLPSRLLSDLHGGRVLDHTLRRAMRVEGVDRRQILCRAHDTPQVERVLRELELQDAFEILATDPGVRLRAGLTRAARKWSIDSWRSNPLGLTWYDEYIDPTILAATLGRTDADAWLCLDGHQAAFDPEIASRMVTHVRSRLEEAPYVFTQGPPGLSGLILTRVAIDDLIVLGCPFGLLLSYRPEMPVADPITAGVCHAVASTIVQTQARVLADTRRSCELLSMAFAELGADVDGERLCTWLRAPGHDRAGTLPVEVEIELTTDDRLEQTTLRPRGDRVPRRTLRDLAALERVAAELGAYDDRLVVIGGHGDPLLHPNFGDACRLLRTSGILAIGVVTPLVELTDASFAALMGGDVDLVEVQLDAHSPATYRQVHRADFHDQVVANIDRIDAARQERRSPTPVVVCSLTRSAATLPELEAFYDHWLKAGSAAMIRGYNEYAGLLPPDAALPTTPPVRRACARLRARAVLHADGQTPICGQDAVGSNVLGSWNNERLESIWTGASLSSLRKRQAELDLGDTQPCARCREWHRP